MKAFKSFLRHLLGAVLTAGGVVISTAADLNWKTVLVPVGAACIPVMVKYLDPTETDFGMTNETVYTEEDAEAHNG